MTPPYAWQCFVCSSGNPAEADRCSACGFPARASGADIAAARAAKAQGASTPRLVHPQPVVESIAEALAPLPVWRGLFAIVGGLSLLGGMLWLKVALSLASHAWSMLAMIFGFAALGIAYAGREGPTKDGRHEATNAQDKH